MSVPNQQSKKPTPFDNYPVRLPTAQDSPEQARNILSVWLYKHFEEKGHDAVTAFITQFFSFDNWLRLYDGDFQSHTQEFIHEVELDFEEFWRYFEKCLKENKKDDVFSSRNPLRSLVEFSEENASNPKENIFRLSEQIASSYEESHTPSFKTECPSDENSLDTGPDKEKNSPIENAPSCEETDFAVQDNSLLNAERTIDLLSTENFNSAETLFIQTLQHALQSLNEKSYQPLKYQLFALIICHYRWMRNLAGRSLKQMGRLANKQYAQTISREKKRARVLAPPPLTENSTYPRYQHAFYVDYQHQLELIKEAEGIKFFLINIFLKYFNSDLYFPDRIQEETTYQKWLKSYFPHTNLTKQKQHAIPTAFKKLLCAHIPLSTQFSPSADDSVFLTIEEYIDKFCQAIREMKLLQQLPPLPPEAYSLRDQILLTDEDNHLLTGCGAYGQFLPLYGVNSYFQESWGNLPLYVCQHFATCTACKQDIEKIKNLLAYRHQHRPDSLYKPHIPGKRNIDWKELPAQVFRHQIPASDIGFCYYLLSLIHGGRTAQAIHLWQEQKTHYPQLSSCFTCLEKEKPDGNI